MLKFTNWIEGDMLCDRDGDVHNGALTTKVSVAAPAGSDITVNGARAAFADGIYTANVTLSQYETKVCATDTASGESVSITLFWLPNYGGKYRVSLDDNIWFLRDIAEHNYDSIFENPYLAFWRELYEEFGTKTHINIYLKDDDDFTIAQVTDKYKAEWAAARDFLRLSFHARANLPARPYLHSGYDEVKRDVDDVRREILRFAGEPMLGPTTTLHWGDATIEGSRALRDAGYTIQVADFSYDMSPDACPIAYYLEGEQRTHMFDRFIWRDTTENITFVRCAIIVNTYETEEIAPFLDDVASDPHHGAYIDLLIHEQYFYESYPDYQPNYREKMRVAVKWAVDNGYESAFLDEVIPG
ncbi:MAG: hypothetical protein RSA70_04935 [Clostridia bacterium]